MSRRRPRRVPGDAGIDEDGTASRGNQRTEHPQSISRPEFTTGEQAQPVSHRNLNRCLDRWLVVKKCCDGSAGYCPGQKGEYDLATVVIWSKRRERAALLVALPWLSVCTNASTCEGMEETRHL